MKQDCQDTSKKCATVGMAAPLVIRLTGFLTRIHKYILYIIQSVKHLFYTML
jgi:hypothetical protein